jgi:uncharacterized membrane protein
MLSPRLACCRRGNVIVLSAFLMVVMLAFVAFACDVGFLLVIRTELQRCADASALAAVWELADEDGPGDSPSSSIVADRARQVAAEFAALNLVGQRAPLLAEEDVEIGYIANPSDPNSPLVAYDDAHLPNAVRVRVRRSSGQNGQVPLFFARVLGHDEAAVEATATAALQCEIRGFQTPSSNINLGIMPIALDVESWDAMMAGEGSDSYAYNAEDGSVSQSSDGVLEINLYPEDTGSAGNRGTVDIGGLNNSTSDISRQIVEGISADDMTALHEAGGTLELDVNSELVLQGDTGLSAEIKEELAAIVGQPRIIPLYSKVENPGNNALYTITRFVGVRVMYANLTGSMKQKKVLVQPCMNVADGGISSSGGKTSEYIYSRAWLVR